ncbi:MAG: hypothetical protein WC516_05790 [Patescibacteria group bacterium]|jgi:hypothetical protein
MKIRVTIRDKVGKDFRVEEIKRIEKVAETDVERIAKRCESVIRYMIENKTDGGTGKLANSDGWTAEPIPGGWGVGDIPTLDKEVAHWNHIDKGSIAIGANWEHELPKGFWQNGRWIESPHGYSGVKPKTPISAVNYIDSTIAQMEMEIPSILKEK